MNYYLLHDITHVSCYFVLQVLERVSAAEACGSITPWAEPPAPDALMAQLPEPGEVASERSFTVRRGVRELSWGRKRVKGGSDACTWRSPRSQGRSPRRGREGAELGAEAGQSGSTEVGSQWAPCSRMRPYHY